MTKLELIKAEFDKAQKEGKRLLGVVNKEHDHILNAVATIQMNAQTEIRVYLAKEYGMAVLKGEENEQPRP